MLIQQYVSKKKRKAVLMDFLVAERVLLCVFSNIFILVCMRAKCSL